MQIDNAALVIGNFVLFIICGGLHYASAQNTELVRFRDSLN